MNKYLWLSVLEQHENKLIPIEEFNNLVNDLGIVDYPGYGYYANDTQFIACIGLERAKIYFNSFNIQDVPEGITHILWFDL